MRAYWKRRRTIFRAVIIAIGATVACVLIAISPVSDIEDPIYRGRRLSVWMSDCGHFFPQPLAAINVQLSRPVPEFFVDGNMYRQKFGKKRADVRDALVDLGEKSFPVLLKMLATPDRPKTRRERWKEAVQNFLVEHELAEPKGNVPRYQAIEAFVEMQWAGCELRNAMPAIKRLQKNPDADVKKSAKFLLEFLEREQMRGAATNVRSVARPSLIPLQIHLKEDPRVSNP